MSKTPITIFMDWFINESNAKKTLTDNNIQEINQKLKQLLFVEKEFLEELYKKVDLPLDNVNIEDIYNKYFK